MVDLVTRFLGPLVIAASISIPWVLVWICLLNLGALNSYFGMPLAAFVITLVIAWDRVLLGFRECFVRLAIGNALCLFAALLVNVWFPHKDIVAMMIALFVAFWFFGFVNRSIFEASLPEWGRKTPKQKRVLLSGMKVSSYEEARRRAEALRKVKRP